jgi:hypothetical protein
LFARIHNRLKARKYSIDRLSLQLREFLVPMLIRLEESSFDLYGPLMIALKPHLDLLSSRTIGLSQTQKAKDSRKEHYEPYYLCCANPSTLKWYEHEV